MWQALMRPRIKGDASDRKCSKRLLNLKSCWVGSDISRNQDFVASVEDESVVARIEEPGVGLACDAVDAVESPQQYRCGIARISKPIVRARQIGTRGCPYHIGGNDHSQLGLTIDVVAALEHRAEDRKLHQSRDAIDLLLGLLLNQACEGEGAAGWNFERRFSTPDTD